LKPNFLKPSNSSTFPRLDWRITTWLVVMHAGALLAPFTFTWPAFYVCIGLTVVVSGLGISVCYHRLLTHRAFKVPKPLEYFLTVLGCMAAQRTPIYWVARHRKHHAFADKDGDPHTPRHGFIWAHMIWPMADLRVEDENEFYGDIAPELANDPGHRFLQKTYEYWPLAVGVVLYLVGGLPFLVWGFFVRHVLTYHLTWIVNSMCHTWGYKSYETRDDAKNIFVLGLLCFGDGFHGNHHAFPSVARHGHHWWEFDTAYHIIRFLGFIGLATDIRSEIPKIRKSQPDEPALKKPVLSEPVLSESVS
jgi:fatty-acid desaturase